MHLNGCVALISTGGSSALSGLPPFWNSSGNLTSELKVIHVAGTNGKGSVCKYISSILQKAGYTVGVYLSPHVERFSERIVVNDQEISEEDLAMLVAQVRPLVEEMKQNNNTPTFFEIVTALAFLHFKNRNVDYAVRRGRAWWEV